MSAKQNKSGSSSKGGGGKGGSAKGGSGKGGTSKTAGAAPKKGGQKMVGGGVVPSKGGGGFADSRSGRALRTPEKRGRNPRSFGSRQSTGDRGEAGADKSVRTLFLRRMNAWSQSLAENAPTEVLADALARPSARSSILYVLDVVPPNEEKGEAESLRERAFQRALSVREELAREAGGMMTTQWVADHLGVKRQSVDRYRTAGKLLAWNTPQGNVFPACQFDANGVVPGLAEVLEEMRGASFWEALAGLLTRAPALGGRSVLEALRTADPEELQRAREVARAYANE